jgi:NADH-quinone oxidoreductase subunit E
MFNLAPVGKFHVQLCGTTPCRLRGADDLEKLCKKKIGDQGDVTEDGKFSWVEVECLGACVNAPMVQINADYYEDLTKETFNQLLDALAAGKKPKPGPQVRRQLSAPIGGPTTLLEDGAKSKARGKDNEPLVDSGAKKAGAAANVQESPALTIDGKSKPEPN